MKPLATIHLRPPRAAIARGYEDVKAAPESPAQGRWFSAVPLLWKIFRKAGFSPWLALIAILPFLGPLISLFILAVLDWPATTKPFQRTAQGDVSGSGRYTCPMHPEVRQPEPGNCPKCGMGLEPIAPKISGGESAVFA